MKYVRFWCICEVGASFLSALRSFHRFTSAHHPPALGRGRTLERRCGLWTRLVKHQHPIFIEELLAHPLPQAYLTCLRRKAAARPAAVHTPATMG